MPAKKTHPAWATPDAETDGLKEFTVLYIEGSKFKRENAEGKVISVTKPEVEIATSYPLEAKQVVYWGDSHKQDNFHFAMVKWVEKTGDVFRVGLSLL